MMELESSSSPLAHTPAHTPPALIRNPPPRALIATVLAPNTEYEVSSSSSPLTARHYSKLAASNTPSPDSAIHSAYYSPSQSPVQVRNNGQLAAAASGFSSPFSLRTTPSLSRNNSDASQYGGSQYSSYSSTASPLSPQQQFSPSHSPVQAQVQARAQPTLPPPPAHAAGMPPASPLPPARHLSLPLYPPHGVMAAAAAAAAAGRTHEDALRRASPISEAEAAGDDKQAPVGGAQQAAGISRQQLINR